MPWFQNPLTSYRARNILAPPSEPAPLTERRRKSQDFMRPLTAQYPQKSEAEKYWDEMNRMQTNVGPGVQAYRDYLKRMPDPEEHRPGWMTRIAAGLAGFGSGVREGAGAGIQTAMGLNRSGYANALQDYSNEGVGLREGAELEQDELDSKLKALQAARAFGLNYDKYNLSRQQAEHKMGVDEYNAETTRMRTEGQIRQWQKPGYEGVPQEDGSILYVNEADPTDRYVVPARTVAAGQLGVSRQNAQSSRISANAAAQNAATNVQRTNIYGQDVANRYALGERGLSMRERGTYSQSGRVPSPADQDRAMTMALRDMLTDPDFADFIEEDADGYPIPVQDDGTEEYQIFRQAMQARAAEILQGGPVGGGRGRGPGR